MDLEDALALEKANNARLFNLIEMQQGNIAALQATITGLTEQIRFLTQTQQQERAAAAQHIATLEAAITRQTGKVDALLVKLDEKKPPKKPTPRAKKPRLPKSETPKNRHKHGRSGPPDHLPRAERHIEVQGDCSHCGHDRLHAHSERISEEYDVVRSYVRVRRTGREVRRCGHCRKTVAAPQPPMPFDQAACTFEMLAYLAYLKLVLFVPLDRIRRDFQAQKVPISPAMIQRWFVRCAELLVPVFEQMRQELLAGDHLQFDGTGLKLLDFEAAGRPVISGQVIVFCQSELVLFHPTESKHGHHIEAFLTLEVDGEPVPWEGTATADAVNIHDQIFNVPGRTEAGCNAHGFRKFGDDADFAPLIADVALGFIGEWYRLEGEAKAAGLSGSALLAHRQTHAGPVATAFRTWLSEQLSECQLSVKNPIRQALQYYDNHWQPLTQFLRDAEVALDNNRSEWLLKNIGLLRKNVLFSGTGDLVSGLCSALSAVQTCRVLGVDPYAYLVWVLPQLVPHSDNRGRDIATLTPAAYKRRREDPEGFD